MKVLTANLHKGFSPYHRRLVLPELREAIKDCGADIVFLQEVLGGQPDSSARKKGWPTEAQYEFLADTTWYEYAYGRNAVYTGGHHGNAVLSRFPIENYDNYDISIARAEKRGLLHAVTTMPAAKEELHLVCVHLGLFNAHRIKQIRMLCRILAAIVPAKAPLIVAGDFNDWRGRAHAPLATEAGLREVFKEAFGKAARSFPARFPIMQLDRIYIRNLRAANPTVLSAEPWSRLSDHAALSVELEIS